MREKMEDSGGKKESRRIRIWRRDKVRKKKDRKRKE